MSTRATRLLILALVAAAAGLFFVSYRSDERAIGRQLSRIQRLAARGPGESDLTGLARARDLAGFFADPFQVVVAGEGISLADRRQLIATIHGYRSRASVLVVEISGREIHVGAGGEEANVFFLVRFLNDLGDLAGSESYRVRLHMERRDREWLIASADLEPLQR